MATLFESIYTFKLIREKLKKCLYILSYSSSLVKLKMNCKNNLMENRIYKLSCKTDFKGKLLGRLPYNDSVAYLAFYTV